MKGNIALSTINGIECNFLGRVFRLFLAAICLSVTISLWMVIGGIGYMITEGVTIAAILITILGIICSITSIILIERYRRG